MKDRPLLLIVEDVTYQAESIMKRYGDKYQYLHVKEQSPALAAIDQYGATGQLAAIVLDLRLPVPGSSPPRSDPVEGFGVLTAVNGSDGEQAKVGGPRFIVLTVLGLENEWKEKCELAGAYAFVDKLDVDGMDAAIERAVQDWEKEHPNRKSSELTMEERVARLEQEVENIKVCLQLKKRT